MPYAPGGLSFRQLSILVDHAEVDFLPIPAKDPHIVKSIMSLVEQRLLYFHHNRHTRITSRGRDVLWQSIEGYLNLFQRFSEAEVKAASIRTAVATAIRTAPAASASASL